MHRTVPQASVWPPPSFYARRWLLPSSAYTPLSHFIYLRALETLGMPKFDVTLGRNLALCSIFPTRRRPIHLEALAVHVHRGRSCTRRANVFRYKVLLPTDVPACCASNQVESTCAVHKIFSCCACARWRPPCHAMLCYASSVR